MIQPTKDLLWRQWFNQLPRERWFAELGQTKSRDKILVITQGKIPSPSINRIQKVHTFRKNYSYFLQFKRSIQNTLAYMQQNTKPARKLCIHTSSQTRIHGQELFSLWLASPTPRHLSLLLWLISSYRRFDLHIVYGEYNYRLRYISLSIMRITSHVKAI